MKPVVFLSAIISGRLVRFGVLSVLTVIFGKEIVDQTKALIKTHPSMLVLIAAAVASFRMGLWYFAPGVPRSLLGPQRQRAVPWTTTELLAALFLINPIAGIWPMLVGISRAKMLQAVGISPSTAERRLRNHERLSLEESDRLVCVAQVTRRESSAPEET